MLCPRVHGVFMFAGNVFGLFMLPPRAFGWIVMEGKNEAFFLYSGSLFSAPTSSFSCVHPVFFLSRRTRGWVNILQMYVVIYADTACCSAVCGVSNSRLTVVSVLVHLPLDCRSAGKHNDKQFLRRQGDHFQVYIRHGIPERDLDNGASCRGIC